MSTYAEQALTHRDNAARLFAKFDRLADQGKNVAATNALNAARKELAMAEKYEELS